VERHLAVAAYLDRLEVRDNLRGLEVDCHAHKR
jgi:hypothetical protein